MIATSRIVGLLSGLLMVGWASAGQTLYDFEEPLDIQEGWLRTPGQDTLSRSTTFATSGRYSLRFTTPQWQPGMQAWPAFNLPVADSDWSAYDRLVVDVANLSPGRVPLNVRVDDADGDWAGAAMKTGPFVFDRIIVPLKTFQRDRQTGDFDKNKVVNLHSFSTTPPVDTELYVDNLVLLKPGQPEPPLPAKVITPLAERYITNLVAPVSFWNPVSGENLKPGAVLKIVETSRLIDTMPAGLGVREDLLVRQAELLSAFEDAIKVADNIYEDLKKAGRGELPHRIAKSDSPSLPGRWANARYQQLAVQRDRFLQISRQAERLAGEAKLFASPAAYRPGAAYALGLADSMAKVPPRDMPLNTRPAEPITLELARQETESVQVVLLPVRETLRGVHLQVGELTGPGGQTLPPEAVDVRVVGFVETKVSHLSDVHVGWWPDPLLDFLKTVDIAPGDAQSFWVRVSAPKDQPAGVYTGEVHVHAKGIETRAMPISVKVHDFAVPTRSPLPMAWHFSPHWPRKFPGVDWEKLEPIYGQFLADYYITIDQLYGQIRPEWGPLQTLKEQGRLGGFNVGDLYKTLFGVKEDSTKEDIAKSIPKFVKRFAANVKKARELGLGDHIYFYGWDEATGKWTNVIGPIAAGVKKAYPDVPIMTTAGDYVLTGGKNVPDVDIWVPLTPYYNPKFNERLRAQGKAVWWYVCVTPLPPYANFFIEQEGISPRMLMGAQTAKYRPDGFLYYYVDKWQGNSFPIVSGPFTQWNPNSYSSTNGDGSLMCAGPDGMPLATIRLENVRDGLEDYAYVRILEATREAVERTQPAPGSEAGRWLKRTAEVLAVPGEVCLSLTDYTTDPALLRTWRARLAEAITTAPIPAVEPDWPVLMPNLRTTPSD